MRLELELDDKTYWVEFKDGFTRGEMRQWFKAQDVGFPEDPAKRENAVKESEGKMLALLQQWCSECYLVDATGKVYNAVSEITLETFDELDWALLDFLFNVPVYARERRGRLGNVVGLPLSRTMRK